MQSFTQNYFVTGDSVAITGGLRTPGNVSYYYSICIGYRLLCLDLLFIVVVCNFFQGPFTIQNLQDTFQKISQGSITNVSTAANIASVPSTVNITDISQNDASVMPGIFQYQINDSSGIMEGITQEHMTSTSNAGGICMSQGNMLQNTQGSQFVNFPTQSTSLGNLYLLQNRTTDPLLSSAGFNVNGQSSSQVQ